MKHVPVPDVSWWGVSPQRMRILARNSGDIGKYAL